ncbi:glycoside hydrolase [Halomonas campisalis]|uniref:Glycoside hydrolase n=1 Tax=Billgrantia campisalis TaxID=74661 RepID=A0ABS9P7H0_9GAMM|nr:NlpC/P60 family protein [Halomonas campisalis]MCG6657389.1 glycoside hydrolase [Halomonas campisalis]MDR5863266.1 NlpC/P60 family protein [Halomonas campisalis]
MAANRLYRAVPIVLSLALLAGCAGSSQPLLQASGDYFARTLPGLPASWRPMMSPVDNPIVEANGLHRPPPSLIRQALLAQHQRWSGTPYRLGGTGERGIDCSALVQNVFRDTFRLDLPRSTGEQVQQGEAVSRDELQVGDLVFFRPPGPYDHVGIYVGEGYFLHASTSQGVMLSTLDNAYWQRHYWQARRALAPAMLAQRVALVGEG